MAKSRLTPDYIEWVLKLNADQAAREMHKINEANKELSRQQNAARQAMTKLASEGKKSSKEWQNLKKSVKEYGDQIKANNEKMKELDKPYVCTVKVKHRALSSVLSIQRMGIRF